MIRLCPVMLAWEFVTFQGLGLEPDDPGDQLAGHDLELLRLAERDAEWDYLTHGAPIAPLSTMARLAFGHW